MEQFGENALRPNPLKPRLAAGGCAFGTMTFEFFTPGYPAICREAGAEFILYDIEYSGVGFETMKAQFAFCRGLDLVSLVRVPSGDYHHIARALDIGAMGIMVPMVESAAQAQAIVAASKYPPLGRRGAAFGVAHDDYAGGNIVEKIDTANSQTLLIAQIETAAGVQNAQEIAAVPGIDVLWIGHFDLTNSLGIPGQFDHPDFQDAVKRVLDACYRQRKVPGFMAGDVPGGKALLDQGFRMIAYGGDLWLYQTALRDGVAALKLHELTKS